MLSAKKIVIPHLGPLKGARMGQISLSTQRSELMIRKAMINQIMEIGWLVV